jgi:phosphoglycolate phosphatase
MSPQKTTLKNIIFDFDGTLGNSVIANWHAANTCLESMGCRPVSMATIRRHLGERAADYYQHLLGSRQARRWPQLKTCVEQTVPQFFRRYLRLFPDVVSTLKTLHQRGYRLILYSNAPSPYFQAVLTATGIKPLFDCTVPMKPRATKRSTIRHLKTRFSGKTAVVGDRDHDLEAGNANDCLTVHCRYGFQPVVKIKPDFTINRFSDLLALFL